MTQNASDVEIANQGFAAFRQDLNDVLEDITTLHSGTAAPSTTYANQWWYETDTDKLYIRNEDNDAWIEILTLDQANDHLASLGASITLDGTGNVSIDSGDFTVDTDTLFVDASADKVGVNTASPGYDFTVAGSADATIAVIADTDDSSIINLGDTSNGVVGRIEYDHSDNSMRLHTAATERMRIDSGGRLLVGTTAAAYSPIQLHLGDTSSSQSGVQIQSSTTGLGYVLFGDGSGADAYRGQINYSHSADVMAFNTAGSERMRIDSSGIVLFGTNDTDPADNNTLGGLTIGQVTGRLLCSVNSAEAAEFNRGGTDGTVIAIRNSGSYVGSISVSGGTTSYNAFSGSHWGRLADNSKPTILRGTVIESIGTMIDWYQVEFDVDIDGETVTKRRNIAKPENVEDGDTFDYIVSDDNATSSVPAGTYTGTLRLEDDEKHPHVKISDTSESKAVYGVFTAWDNDDDTVNDMYVTAVGTGVVRILSTETVAIGDLLDSNGDGTAKVQSDDIIRSRTIGKVLSTVKQETYSDGSYTVPCALYCG